MRARLTSATGLHWYQLRTYGFVGYRCHVEDIILESYLSDTSAEWRALEGLADFPLTQFDARTLEDQWDLLVKYLVE